MISEILYVLLLPYLAIRIYLEARKMKREGAMISLPVWIAVLTLFFISALFLRTELAILIIILSFLVYEYLRESVWEKQTGKSATSAFGEFSQKQRILMIIIYFILVVSLFYGMSYVVSITSY